MRKSTMLSKVRFGVLSICAVAAVAFALSPVQAQADEITLAGTTTGTFNNGSNVLGYMSFQDNLGFSATTSGGTAALNLGAFSLGQNTYDYSNSTFTLDINFTSPTGAASPTSTAQITGSVTSPNSGGVWVWDFNPSSMDVYFNGGADYFQLALNSVSLSPGTSETLTGFVYYTGATSGITSVPEPPTMLLAGLGIAGVFLLKRRLLLA